MSPFTLFCWRNLRATKMSLLFFFLFLFSNTLLQAQELQQAVRLYIKLKDTYEFNIPNERDKVALKDARFLQPLLSTYSLQKIRKPFYVSSSSKLQRTFEITLNDHRQLAQFLHELQKLPMVEYAEKVPERHTTTVPNDPAFYPLQWHLHRIKAPQAWNYSTGNNTIIVGVPDVAVSNTHPDLVANLWINSKEIAGNNIDDDNNGYIDDVKGWDAGDVDNDPNIPNTSWNHGTHVAGTITSETNNNKGVASMGYSVKYIPIKCEPDTGSNKNLSYAFEGFMYAVAAGADIISMSWGGPDSSITEQNLIDDAHSKGIVLVAAAGNDNVDSLFYPAAYNHIITVASSAENDTKSSFSNYGSWIDVTAPGSNIYSTVPDSAYALMSGTSMATPLVSGLCALMLSLDSTLTPDQIQNCLQSTADDISLVNPNYIGKLGAGRINAVRAMECVAVKFNKAPVADFTADKPNSCNGKIQFTDLSYYMPTNWTWSFGDGSTSTSSNPQHTYSVNGTYEVRLNISNANGQDSMIKSAYITVSMPQTPTVTGATRCGGGSLLLKANGTDSLEWYSNLNSDSIIYTGNNFNTPVITNNTVYYVQNALATPIQKMGPANNTIGAGSNFNANSDRHLKFDVYAPCRLISVLVYAQGAGNRVFQLCDNGGYVLQSKTINVANGSSRVILDFMLSPGKAYQLKLGGVVNLYRNSAGATYPYTLPGLLSITGNDVSSASPSYYYFFYDWEVQAIPCASIRIPVTAVITPSTWNVNVTPAGNTTLCQGDSVMLTADPGLHYKWSNGDTTQSITVKTSGNYFVEASSDTSACSAVSPVHSVFVNTPLTPVVTQKSDSLLCTTPGVSFQWYLNGNPINGATGTKLKVLQDGNYYVVITDNKGCKYSSTPKTITVSGLPGVNAQHWHVYPNPAHDRLTIESDALLKAGTAKIVDMIGQVVLEEKLQTAGQTVLSLSSLAPGVYYLTVQYAEGLESLKLLVQ